MIYREADTMVEEFNEARDIGELRKYRAQLGNAELLVIDDHFLRRFPSNAGDELGGRAHERYGDVAVPYPVSHNRY